MATIDQVATRVELIDQKFDSKEETDKQRRIVDDARFTVLTGGQKEVLARVETHGTRTTALETKWAAFFGDEGAFKAIMKRIDSMGDKQDDQGKKIDKLTWIVAGGLGAVSATQFIIEFFVRR